MYKFPIFSLFVLFLHLYISSASLFCLGRVAAIVSLLRLFDHYWHVKHEEASY